MSWIKSCFFSLCAFPLFANPVVSEILHGEATLSQCDPYTLEVRTEQEKTVIHWKEFSIQKGETTHFIQPSSSSATLNRVVGVNPSELLGTLHSNGHVYLMNPNGLVIGEGAFIDTAAFIGSTFDVLDHDFLKGEGFELKGDSLSRVINYGKIHTREGDAFLVGRIAENHGEIDVNGGCLGVIACTSLLYRPNEKNPIYVKGGMDSSLNREGNAYSHAMKINADSDALMIEKKDGEIFLTQAKNSGTLRAKNGQKGSTVHVLGDHVFLEEGTISVSAPSGEGQVNIGGSYKGQNKNILASQLTFVSKESRIEANALEEGHGGQVVIWSDHETRYYGHVDARGGAEGGNGGFLEVSSPSNEWSFRGTIDLSAPKGNSGELLLDPNDITVGTAASAPAYGGSPYDGAPSANAQLLYTDLAAALGAGNVTIQTSSGTAGGNGDIFFDLGGNILTWASGNNLTVNADRDIHFLLNSDIQTTGAGTDIVMTAGRSFISENGSAIEAQGAGGNLFVTATQDVLARGGIFNSNTAGTDANVRVIAQTGEVRLGDATSTVPVVIGSIHGPVYVEALQGDINLLGGTGADNVAIIGYYDTPGADPTTGSLTVLAGNDMNLLSGTGVFSSAMVCKQGRSSHDITNNPVLVNVRRDLLIQAGNAQNAPGAGIGRPQQLLTGPSIHNGDITVNVGRDCTIFGGDNFSGIGDRAIGQVGGNIAANLRVNVGRNLMMGHAPGFFGRSGAFIGVFDNTFNTIGVPENVQGSTHINVGNNFVMDGRQGAAFVELQNDNTNLGTFPAELFVHVGNSLILIGGPQDPPSNAILGAAFDYVEVPNSNSHFWAINSIQCVNGPDAAAQLHAKIFSDVNTISPNLGTISVRAGGDIRVAGGGFNRLRPQGPIVDYEATGGFTYIADSPFANGELWGPQVANVGGVNVFAGTPLGSASPVVFSNGRGAVAFDTNFYDTPSIPLSTQQIAAQGYGSFAQPGLVTVGRPITYWSQNGSDTLISTRPLFADGSPADILNIGTTGPSISFNNQNRGGLYASNVLNADGRNVTIIAFRDTVISGPSTVNPIPAISTIPIYAPSGNILVITQNDMTMQNNAVVSALINVDLVSDNQAPAPPQIGPGGFFMDATSFINSDTGYIRVYTARQAQNIIDPLAQFISAGVPYFFVPGQLFVNTDQEKWCTYYPNGDQGIPFKIFYKPCLTTIAQEAMVILTEFLYEESSFNYYLGWPQQFEIQYTSNTSLNPGEWKSTFDSFNVSPTEHYFIRRQDDTRANNNPQTYKTW